MTNDQEKLKGMIDNLARVYYQERGELDAVLPLNPTQFRTLSRHLSSPLSGPEEGYVLHSIETPYGSVPVVVDRECPPDKMYFIQADSYFSKKG